MYHPEKINRTRKRVTEEVRSWLRHQFDLDYGDDAEATFVIRENGSLIATASRAGNVFKYFGIDPAHQGENLSGILLGALMDEAFSQGIYHYFIFTSPDNAPLFAGSGFNLVIANDFAALLEGGNGSIDQYMAGLRDRLGPPRGKRGAIVMNLNPMTLGHLYLIETAAQEMDELVIFLVEEDLSVFPFQDRLSIAKAATAHLSGVHILPGGPYMISRATFPTYFLKKADENLIAYTTTDAGIFGRYYARALGISKRFVGEEPLDPVTSAYNDALVRELAHYDVAFQIIPRRQIDGQVISASRVRRFLAQGHMAQACRLVPPATCEYLKSAKGQRVIEAIRRSDPPGAADRPDEPPTHADPRKEVDNS